MNKKLFTTVAATVALVATPVLAQSDIAQRAAAQIQNAEELGEDDNGGTLLALLAGGLIIAGVVVALSGGDDDLPTSP
jgi:hypothetical protein